VSTQRKPLDQKFKQFVEDGLVSDENNNSPSSEEKPLASPRKENLMTVLATPSKDKSRPMTISIKESVRSKLETLKNKTGRNMSDLIEFALERLFEEVEDSQ
jgi:hypothetical protein